MTNQSNYRYKTDGGAIDPYAPSRVKRESDDVFLQAMSNQEYCHIYSGWQMGKTSLLLWAKKFLEQQGHICIWLELSPEATNFEHWCKNMTRRLGEELEIFSDRKLADWIEKQKPFSVSTYIDFIDKIVLEKKSSKIYIFYDEINVAKKFSYSIDDFWSAIATMYDRRQNDDRYKRLTFAFAGVTTPHELIRDKRHTSISIGREIKLSGIKLEEALPLLGGLQNNVENAESVLNKIIRWTGGQPFLTQNFCAEVQKKFVSSGEEECIEEIANHYINKNTRYFDNINYQFEITESEDSNDDDYIIDILGTYIKIIENKCVLEEDYSEDCQRLFGYTLIKIEAGEASVFSPLHEKIFTKEWAKKHIDSRCPWSKQINQWSIDRKKSLLVKGTELKEFNSWASNKRLTKEQAEYKLECNTENIRRKYDHTLDTLVAEDLSKTIYGLREFKRFSGHNNVVKGVAISGNENTIVSASADKTIKIWRQDGTLIQTLRGHKEEVQAVAISPDGNTIVSGSANKMTIWRKNGTLFQTLKEYNVATNTIAFSSDGKTIAIASAGYGNIALLEINGNLIRTIKRRSVKSLVGKVNAIAFSPNSKIIAIASDNENYASDTKIGGIELWHFQGNLIKTFRSHKIYQETVTAIAFSPNGKTIVSGSLKGRITRWDINYTQRHGQLYNPKAPIVFAGHYGRISGVAIDPQNKKIISAGNDKTIKIWDMFSLYQIAVLEGHKDSIEDMAISLDGETIISAGKDATVRLWKHNNDFVKTLIGYSGLYGRPDYNTRPIGKYSHTLSRIHEHLPGQHSKETISYIPDNKIELRNQNSQDYITIGSHDEQTENSTYDSGDGKIVLVDSEGRLEIKGNNNGLLKTEIIFLKRGKNSYRNKGLQLAVGDDSITVSGGADDIIRLEDLDGNVKVIKTFQKRHQDVVWAVGINRNGQTIVSQDEDGKIIFWNEDGTVKKEIEQPKRRNSDPLPLKGIAVSPNRKYVALASADKTIEIRDTEGELLKTIPNIKFTLDFDGEIWNIAFSSDSKFLFSTELEEDKPSNPRSYIWNIEKILKIDEREYAYKIRQDYLDNNYELEERTIYDDI